MERVVRFAQETYRHNFYVITLDLIKSLVLKNKYSTNYVYISLSYTTILIRKN